MLFLSFDFPAKLGSGWGQGLFILLKYHPVRILQGLKYYLSDPSRMTDEWRLTDGFVAEEGKVLLTNLASIR